MSYKNLLKITSIGLISTLGAAVNAASVPVDLSSWSANTLDFPGGQPAGNWVPSAGDTTVEQTVNADPSFFLNNLNQTDYTMQGSWKVNTSSDNDFMGFVFGYQNSSNFYLFDWKQGTQNYSGATAAEGMAVKKYQGATGNGLNDLSLGELWENVNDSGDMTVLAKNQGAGTGWENFTEYDFFLDFNTTAGEFDITVEEAGTELWNISLSDSTFSSGQFGFYNYSQSNIIYAGFEQEGGVIVVPDPSVVPEPGTMGLLAASLTGLFFARRRRLLAKY